MFPEPRIDETFFSNLASCSRAISCGSFILERCTCRTRIGFSRRSPCKVVSDGREKEGRKKDASSDRAAILALLLCFVKAGLLNVEEAVVPHSSVIILGCCPCAAVTSREALRTAAWRLCPRAAAGESRRRWEMAA